MLAVVVVVVLKFSKPKSQLQHQQFQLFRYGKLFQQKRQQVEQYEAAAVAAFEF